MVENNLCKIDVIDLDDSEAKKAFVDYFMAKLKLLSPEELMESMGQIVKDTEKLLSKNGFEAAGLTEKWELNKEILDLSKWHQGIFALELDFIKETFVTSVLEVYHDMQTINQIFKEPTIDLLT